MISELLEEAGVDRDKLRALRRQVLQGIVLLCQWQLDRLDRAEADAARTRGRGAGRARRVPVE
jgi:hypothetical protein